jgi:hypothetical protein
MGETLRRGLTPLAGLSLRSPSTVKLSPFQRIWCSLALAINLKTATVLSLTIPPALLTVAHEVNASGHIGSKAFDPVKLKNPDAAAATRLIEG